MTAAAMIVGMMPMAIGGAGEEQNAALARAVIGGLLFATPTTLLVVPYLFAMLRKGNDGKPAHGVFAEDWNEQGRAVPDDRQSAAWRHRRRTSSRTGGTGVEPWARAASGIVALLLLAGALGIGAWHDTTALHAQVMATAEQRRDFVPSVRVATIARAASIVSVSLPATTAAFAQANIYARASGYIAKRNVDIGDQVKAGPAARRDHRARARSPDRAGGGHARADARRRCSRRKAKRDLAQVTWDRDKPLVEKGWVTAQQGDIDQQTLQAKAAAVCVAQANIEAQQRSCTCCISRRPIRAWSRRSMASSRSAISTSAAWCRPTPPAALSCSP